MIVKEVTFDPILIDSRCLRKGVLLKLVTADGRVATAEISPLPGYSRESIKEVMGQLQAIRQRILTTWWTKQALYFLDNLGLYPSTYFGVESALLDLLDPLSKHPPPKKYSLLLGTPDEILARADEVSREGYREAKVKLGHFTPETAVEITTELIKLFRLRIDLNQKWSLEETEKFCSHFNCEDIVYIEEPTKHPEDLINFAFPFALDETLRDTFLLTPYLANPYLKALVIKPTMLYPLTRFLSLGKEIILTSSFEGPIGIGQISRMVYRLKLDGTFHGLDTLRYIETDATDTLLPYPVLADTQS